MDLIKKIKSKKAQIGIIGLGYVGLPLLIEFCKAGFLVTGFDIDKNKIKSLQKNKSYISHVDISSLKQFKPHLNVTTDFSKLSEVDCIIICVPTPLNRNRNPDLSFVINTTRTISKYLEKGHLIVLESTTYPGTTDEDIRTILEETGLKAGKDFYLAYSPEREDPNNKNFTTSTIPKVVGGFTRDCCKVSQALYDSIINKTITVSSTKVAESTKLLENIYRSVNIALVNELKMLFDRMGIDIWEVIDAANTKPFGFHAFYPGPGLGGHCIPIDPFYLTWKAREFGISTKFIELAGEINTHMPYYVVQKTIEALNERGKSVKGSKILILGLSYKKNIEDVRESPSLMIIDLLQKRGARVDYNDPHVPETHKMRKYNLDKTSVPLIAKGMRSYDCTVIVTDHDDYDPDFIVKNSKIVIDTRNLIKHPAKYKKKIIQA